ncbi:MAG: hypothetical protein LBE46_04875 [Wolbachia pipientis]|nr:hypothetical protein [Wolbachia pipientis]
MESFSGSSKDSNFIKGTKIVENFSDNNENGSSIFQGKIREQAFSAEQKLNELKAAIEELDRQDLLRRTECERQASSCVDEIPSQVELYTKGGDEGYFDCEKPLGDFWSFFESLFNLFEVNVDQEEVYQMIKEKKEKNLIAAIIKFLRDKLKELIKKIFKSNLDLSWDKRLDKEIKELQEKLGSGELSEEEFARVLERLQALTDLKFKLQMAVTGWIVTMFAEMFGVELAAIVETAKAENKKAEKTSLEAIKEVHEEVEIKIDEREKPKVPVSLFEVLYGFVRPVVLSKPELDLLPKPMKELMPKEVIKEEIREIKETKPKVEEEKKAKPEEPKKEVCPPAPKTATNTAGMGRKKVYGCDSNWQKRRDIDADKESVSVNNCGFDFTNIGTWKGAEYEPKQSSVGGAQEDPRSKVTDVLNERAARGNGNTPSR